LLELLTPQASDVNDRQHCQRLVSRRSAEGSEFCQSTSWCSLRALAVLRASSGPNSSLPPRLQDLRHTFAVHSIAGWSQAGWSCEKMLPMLTAYMGNVREKGFLRYFELTPSRYRAQLACLDVRTTAPDLAGRPAKSDEERRRVFVTRRIQESSRSSKWISAKSLQSFDQSHNVPEFTESR
jgi:hypothetical protein